MARSGWVAVAITALVVAGLGSPPAVDQAGEAGGQVEPLLRSLTAFPAWSTDSFGGEGDTVGPIAAKVVLLLVVVFIGTGVTGQVGSATASFLAGWGAVMVGAALAGAVFVAAADAFAFDGALADSSGGAFPLVVGGANDGVQFGLYTGWLVGLGVVLTARRLEPEDDQESLPGWITSARSTAAGPPASATSYPTVYPPLPSGSDWSGPLTRPVPTAVEGDVGPTDDDGALAPPTEWPHRTASPGSGAYRRGTGEAQRPNWTRWSDRG